MRTPSSYAGIVILAAGLTILASGRAAAQTPSAPGAAKQPNLTFAFQARVELGPVMELGQVPRGRRRIIPITGGTFEGSGMKGRVLNNGADWQIVRADGFSELDTRYALETDKGQIIYIQNVGMRHAAPEVQQKLAAGEIVDPNTVYFRTVPTFETSAPELQWLTRSIFVGVGERLPTHVLITFWRLE